VREMLAKANRAEQALCLGEAGSGIRDAAEA
jgi:hypothetical protein